MKWVYCYPSFQIRKLRLRLRHLLPVQGGAELGFNRRAECSVNAEHGLWIQIVTLPHQLWDLRHAPHPLYGSLSSSERWGK